MSAKKRKCRDDIDAEGGKKQFQTPYITEEEKKKLRSEKEGGGKRRSILTCWKQEFVAWGGERKGGSGDGLGGSEKHGLDVVNEGRGRKR